LGKVTILQARKRKWQKAVAVNADMVAEIAAELRATQARAACAERLAIILGRVAYIEDEDGCPWVERSLSQWRKTFHWLTVTQVRKAFDQLAELGFIEKSIVAGRSGLAVRTTGRCDLEGQTSAGGGATLRVTRSDPEGHSIDKPSSALSCPNGQGERGSPVELFEEGETGERRLKPGVVAELDWVFAGAKADVLGGPDPGPPPPAAGLKQALTGKPAPPKSKAARKPCVGCSGRGYPMTEMGCPLGYPYTDCKFCGGTGFEPEVAPELKPPKYSPEHLKLAQWHFREHAARFVLDAKGVIPRSEPSLAAAFKRSAIPVASLQAAFRWAFAENHWRVQQLLDLVKLTTVPATLVGLEQDWQAAGRPGETAAKAGDWQVVEVEDEGR
jgi:hypothetical protein